MPGEIIPVTTPDTAEKRGRRRPKGSKTKNRIREESVLVPRPIRRPRHYSLSEAAAELGVSHTFLYQLANEAGEIFKSAAKSKPSLCAA